VDLEAFTPWTALAGGALIGLAASLLLLVHGRVAGVSGILGGLLAPRRGDARWRALFLVGLLVAGLAAVRVAPASIEPSPRGPILLMLAGLLVGLGTRLGGGCTSGHGVCGLSRLSTRALAATAAFMITGITTAILVRVLGGAT
jgi:uncharacterized protein